MKAAWGRQHSVLVIKRDSRADLAVDGVGMDIGAGIGEGGFIVALYCGSGNSLECDEGVGMVW